MSVQAQVGVSVLCNILLPVNIIDYTSTITYNKSNARTKTILAEVYVVFVTWRKAYNAKKIK